MQSTIISTRGAASSLAGALVMALLALPAGAQVRCGDVIGPGQEVVLSADLECDDVAVGLVVTGPAVLSMNDFSVTCADRDAHRGAPRIGILVLGSGVTLHGGVVSDCHNGIVVAGSGNHELEDVSVLSGSGDGIVLASHHNRIRNALVSFHGGRGVSVRGRSNVVSDSAASGNRSGFHITQRSTLARNLATANEGDGFTVGGSGSVLTENRALGNRIGFLVHGDGNRLVANQGEENLVGLFLDLPSSGNALYRNVMSRNLFAGFIATGAHNRLMRNRTEENLAYGVHVTTSASATAVVGTVARGNGIDLVDETPGCGANRWRSNVFETRNRTCIE